MYKYTESANSLKKVGKKGCLYSVDDLWSYEQFTFRSSTMKWYGHC